MSKFAATGQVYNMVSNFQQTTKVRRKGEDLVGTIWNDGHHVGEQHSSSSIREGLSYEAESETAKVFSKENSPGRFQPGVQIWWSISNNKTTATAN